ncbi:hypothetical protein C2S51_010043 [Perilla frutescens var. frutescens]|nr:hypothetical protein C2S51_010043 [Perilla frutescens var. frutescens]
MSVIREVLHVISGGPELFEQFRRESCFGHLIDFVGGNSCNNALHALLSREVIIDGAEEHDFWFWVGETNIRFSPSEFALVTGLQFGGSDFDPSTSHKISRRSFYSRELNKTTLRVKDLLERFRTYSLGDDLMDYVMVANVLFLHTMIFGYNQTHMIDDWVELRRKFKKTEEKARLSYHFYGPVWALLVWAYEALPRLGAHCAQVPAPDALPRCLKWAFKTKTMRLGTLFSDEQLCFIYLQPSEHEMATSYYRSVLLGDCMGVTYEAQRNKRVKPTYRELARAHQPRAPSPPRAPSHLGQSGSCIPRTCTDTGAVESSRRRQTRPTDKRPRLATPTSSTSEDHQCCKHKRDEERERARRQENDDMFHRLKDFVKDVFKKFVPRSRSQSRSRSRSRSRSQGRHEEQAREESPQRSAPRPIHAYDVEGPHLEDVHVESVGATVDDWRVGSHSSPVRPSSARPSSAGVSSSMREFVDFRCCGPDARLRVNLIELELDQAFFDELLDTNRDMSSQCMDLILYCLQIRLAEGRGLKAGVNSRSTVVLQSSFFYKLVQEYHLIHPDDEEFTQTYPNFDYAWWGWDDELVDIVRGDQLLTGPWWQANSIITAYHVDGHWVTVRIRLDAWRVELYWEKARRTEICRPLEYYRTPLMYQFRQIDGVSCGVFSVMQADRLISSKKFNMDPTPDDLDTYRKLLAVRIFALCWSLWLERNRRVFEDKEDPLEEVPLEFKEVLDDTVVAALSYHSALSFWWSEMAYAAVISLLGAIDGLFDSHCISLGTSTRECLQSVHDHATSLATTLERCSEGVGALEEEKVSETIEEHVKELFMPKAEEEVSSATDECDMVGLLDQFLWIRDKLIASKTVSFDETVIWISGMAGIGKTRLAKKLLQDPSVKAHFECVAFVRVGPVFWHEEVLDAITAQLNLQGHKMITEGSFEQRFRRILTLRKSLIVLDDLWEDVYFLLYGLLGNETQILVTSREHMSYIGYLNMKMRFLDEEESWELLRRNVFGEEECPPQLVKAAKKIAKHCEGLPLLINAVTPILLSEAHKNPECWNRVAEKPHSLLEKSSHQIAEVLLSSYHPLTEYEKLCFLYLAAFPLKYIVQRSRIINFWHVEGFHYTLPIDYSDTYKKLLKNNLFMCHEEDVISGISKACSLHCTYWYMSKRVAMNNKFLYTINGHEDASDECVKSHRRLAIYENVLFAIKEVHKEISSISTIRSLLCTGPYHQYQVPICTQWKVLRVFNAVTIRFYEFPVEVLKLILLRYLALTCNAELPASISKLWNLKFLIVHQHSGIKRVGVESYVPVEVWDLQELEHLEIMGRNLHDPPRPGAVLPNLKVLLDVGVKSCTEAVLQSLPDLQKIRIQIEFEPNATETMTCFDHISCLYSLDSFHSLIINPTLLRPPPPLVIPSYHLAKLTLSGFGYPWENMRKICELRYLKELKLQHYAFRGEMWDAKVIKSSNLWGLTIEDTDLVEWTAEDESFSSLWYLTFKNCYKLREIPRFPHVLNIKLVDCNPLAETCAKQKHPGVDWISRTEIVGANYSWK